MGLHVTGNGLQVVDHPSGGFRVGEDHGLNRFASVSLQGVTERFGVQGLAPLSLDHLHLQAVGAGHLHPALAEFAVIAAEHPVAAAEGVDDPGFHGGRAAAGDHQHIILGLMQPLQLLGCAAHDGLEFAAAVTDRVATHGLQHRLGNRSGTRDHQGELVLHSAGAANR